MKIAILGTRGVPNNHGGFEQFAEYLSVYLAQKGHDTFVYNSHDHPYQEKTWNGVNILHQKDPENKIGTAGQFIYDLNCIRDARKRNFDIILQLGYTSSSVWGKLLPKKAVIITNMDGMEWKRSKYSNKVRKFLMLAEKLAVKTSDYLVSDSIGVQDYLDSKYQAKSTFIPYGAFNFVDSNENSLKEYGLERHKYSLLIARLEPENSIEVILDGVVKSKSEEPFLVIGKHDTKYGGYLKHKFKDESRIQFLGGIYDIEVLNNLRFYSRVYFHGHTVGGTNPSLLEAMASYSLICANNNPFNKYILQEDGLYFNTSSEVTTLLDVTNKNDYSIQLQNNRNKIDTLYNWDIVNKQYEDLFESVLNR